MMDNNQDFIGKHKVVTRLANIVMIAICAWLAWTNSSNDKLIEYSYWALVFMFSAHLFGDKMLVQIKDIVAAWRGAK